MPTLIAAAMLAVASPAGTGQLPTAPDPVLARMAALYDEVCLQAFPIDAAVDKLMADKGAIPLTPEAVKVTLVDDPGRGWSLKDGDREVLVFLELPPFHACTVRRFTANGFADLSAYRAVADRFEAGHAGFSASPPQDFDRGGIHVHMAADQRRLPGGGGESLIVVDQHKTDPAARAKGETGVNVRFVHQIHVAP